MKNIVLLILGFDCICINIDSKRLRSDYTSGPNDAGWGGYMGLGFIAQSVPCHE